MKVPANYRYHCFDREPPAGIVTVQDGWNMDGTRRTRVILDPMTKDCRYAAHGYADSDPGCSGCKWLPEGGCKI